jgi:hypothetical protein
VTIGARTLGPHQGAGHVETLLGQQVVQVVAGDLPLDPAQLHAEVGQVVVGQLLELICQFEGCGTRLRLLVLRVCGAQPVAVAVSRAPSEVTTSISTTWSEVRP